MIEVFAHRLIVIQVRRELLSLLLVGGDILTQALRSGLRRRKLFLSLGHRGPLTRGGLRL